MELAQWNSHEKDSTPANVKSHAIEEMINDIPRSISIVSFILIKRDYTKNIISIIF